MINPFSSLLFSGGSDILCSAYSVESLLYTTVFAIQTGVTLTSIMFYSSRNISSLSSLLSGFTSLFQRRTHSFLAVGVLIHVFSLLSSSFVEEEHQTWYFFTSTLFIIIFCDKSTVFCERKKRNDSGVSEGNPFQPESLEDQNPRRYRNDKTFDHGKDFCNAEFPNGHDTSTDVNLDSLASKKGENLKSISRKNVCFSREATQIVSSKNGVSRSCLGVVVLLGLGRLSRAWNQTGIKWADRADIGDWLVKPENKPVLSMSYVISLLFIICFRYNRQDILTSVVFIIGTAHAYFYRAATGSLQLPWLLNEQITKGISEARFTYCCVATIVVWNAFRLYRINRSIDKRRLFKEYIHEVCGSLEGIFSGFLLLEVLVQRPHNVVLLAVFVVQEHMVSEIFLKR